MPVIATNIELTELQENVPEAVLTYCDVIIIHLPD
jgi:hypothetical protein